MRCGILIILLIVIFSLNLYSKNNQSHKSSVKVRPYEEYVGQSSYQKKLKEMSNVRLLFERHLQAEFAVLSCTAIDILSGVSFALDTFPFVSYITSGIALQVNKDYGRRSFEGIDGRTCRYKEELSSYAFGSIVNIPIDLIAMFLDVASDSKLKDDYDDEFYEWIFQFTIESYSSTLAINAKLFSDESICKVSYKRMKEAQLEIDKRKNDESMTEEEYQDFKKSMDKTLKKLRKERNKRLNSDKRSILDRLISFYARIEKGLNEKALSHIFNRR